LRSRVKSAVYSLFFLAICFVNSYGSFANLPVASNFTNEIELSVENTMEGSYSAFDFQLEESFDRLSFAFTNRCFFFEITEFKQVRNILEISLDSNSPPPRLL
jgi:hypothetical protein